MAHQLKYYKEIASHGHDWRLEIHQDTEEALTPMEIGPVLQSLRLVVQGEQADIDTPIVKTSLEMSFVDAPDFDEERKCGYWEEFYTSSATEYKVILLKDGQTEWTGYITPDSFAEDLRYRGSVSIIARDNLGMMQDYDFDLEGDQDGLITLLDLVHRCAEKVSFAMSIYDDTSTHSLFPVCVDATSRPYLLAAKFNVASFRDGSLWDAVESALYAVGVSLHYVGENTYVLHAIRSLGLGLRDNWADIPVHDVRFLAHGRRELTPAAKKIKEEVTFEIDENIIDAYTPGHAYGAATTYQFGSEVSTQPTVAMPIHAVDAGLMACTTENTILLDPFRYKVNQRHRYGTGGEIQDASILYVAANLIGGTAVINARKVGFSVEIPAGTYRIEMEINKAVALYDGLTTIGYADYDTAWRFGYEARFDGVDGSVKTLNNRSGLGTKEAEWEDVASTGYHSLNGVSFPTQVSSPDLVTEVAGTLTIKLLPADLLYAYTAAESQGGYVGVKDIRVMAVDNGNMPIMENLRITTEYDDRNNVVLTRSPKYAPNPSATISHRQLVNGIFVNGAEGPVGSERWIFHESDIPKPLAVLIHQQMLAYYARPNNVLTGELFVEDGMPDFASLWRWNNADHILLSGTLNILSGRMEGATLRQFVRYDHMWETWVEEEDIILDYGSTSFTINSHKEGGVTEDDIKGLPSWVTLQQISSLGGNKNRIDMRVMENATGETRQAQFKVDTAVVRITQMAAGDFGMDYSSDFS